MAVVPVETGGFRTMTTQTIRNAAAFPALVTAAFFVRNGVLIATLLALLLIVYGDI